MKNFRALVAPFLFLALIGMITFSASAGVITTYAGNDIGANAADPRPNSNAAAASFDTAVGPVSIITFESAPLGNFTNLVVAPGVTINGADYFSSPQTIINSVLCSGSLCGFNTTLAGEKWASFYGGSLTFTFANPANFFGAYLSGVQVGGLTITFNDGAPQSVAIPNPGSGVQFLGFTDTSSFSSLTINASNDIIGIDDVRYATGQPPEVPEPATFALMGSALAGLGLLRYRRSR